MGAIENEKQRQPGYWLAIDQGTTSTRATLFDQVGQVIATARRSIDIVRGPLVGHVEQDADQIAQSVDEAVSEVVDAIDDPQNIRGAGLATQRSSVVAWDRATGKPLSRVLSWQDTRCEDVIAAMHEQAAEIQQRTGLPLTAHYGASKIGWLLHEDHNHSADIAAAAEKGRLTIGPLASFVAQSMLVHREGTLRDANVDHANGGRTQLMNVATGDWDERLLQQFDVPKQILPTIRPTEFDYGRLHGAPANLLVVQGDQTAAIYGHGGLDDETAHVNLGTGGFILTQARALTKAPKAETEPSDPRLLRSIARSRHTTAGENRETDFTFVVEGTVNGCGSAGDWAATQRGLKVNDDTLRDWLSSSGAGRNLKEGQEVPIFLNTIGGLGSPFWKTGPPATWSTNPANDEVAMLAVLESILFLVLANVNAMQTTEVVKRLRVTGGLAASDALCQKLSDISGLPVCRPSTVEATSRGAAWLAAGMPEEWLTKEAMGEMRTWEPQSDASTKACGERGEQFLLRIAGSP